MSMQVLAPGLLTTVQDCGRHGYAALGVGTTGAIDSVALRLANMLVGNAENAAALEVTLRGPRLRFDTDSLIAITGAEVELRCNDQALPSWRPALIRAGGELSIGNMRRGARAYLAIAGGVCTSPVLGSRSVDINTCIGGRAISANDELATLTAPRSRCASLWDELRQSRLAAAPAKWSIDPAVWFQADSTQAIHVTTGAHFADLDFASRERLLSATFRIGADSNRVGYRLGGVKLALREPMELVSAGVVPGTVQLPPGGEPIVLMAEAPTTGGYPRIAHVIGVDLPHLAQRRPGDSVRFAEISLAEAQTRYLEHERALASIARTVSERLHT